MYDTAADLLQAVYDDLRQPGRRCKGRFAKTKNDTPIHWTSPKAAQFSTDGKLLQLCGDEISKTGLIVVRQGVSHEYTAANEALDATLPIVDGSIATNNDDLDDEGWARWMEAAIAYAKAQEAD